MYAGVTVWFFMWQALYRFLGAVNPYFSAKYSTLVSAKKTFWNESMVSSIMSVLLCGMAAEALLESTDMFVATPAQLFTLQVFVGYLCSDLFLSIGNLRKWPGAKATILHHSVAIGTMLHVGMSPAGHALLMNMILAEFSTPFINQLFFLDTIGMKESRLYAINGVCIVVFWFVFRILNIGWVCWQVAGARAAFGAFFNVDAMFLGLLVIYGFQWVWFYRIVKGAAKMLTKLNLNESGGKA